MYGSLKIRCKMMTLRKKVDDDGTCFDYFGSGGCGYVLLLLNLKGGNPLEGNGDPYSSWPTYCHSPISPIFWVKCVNVLLRRFLIIGQGKPSKNTTL